MKTTHLLALALVVASCTLAATASTSPLYPANGANYKRFSIERPPLLPKPQKCQWADKSIQLNKVSISLGKIDDKEKLYHIKDQLTKYLDQHGVEVVKAGEDNALPIIFKCNKSMNIPGAKEAWQKDESYKIKVGEKSIIILASSAKGYYYGMQTLMQLILRRDDKTSAAACIIADWPDFEVRGFMNDVGRNFMPIKDIMQELDAMAKLKFNVYHFHFTENDAWRLESKLYPELNAARHHTRWAGKVYSQKDFQKLVRACELRNIQLIPEMDMPGHSAAFRRALGLKNMENEKATKALTELIAEMCELVPVEKMPYIHIGTDEVKGHERVNAGTIKQYYDAVEKAGRQVIRWQHGLHTPKGAKRPIEQIWTGRLLRKSHPSNGARYIDSHETYLNHLDPFETAATFYFRRPCPFLNAQGMGMVLCSWPDLPMADTSNHTLQTPVYPSLAFASEPLWNTPHEPHTGNVFNDPQFIYFSNLPPQGSELLKGFEEYENRVLAFRDRFMKKHNFAYVRQANKPWKIIGPFPHGGKYNTVFPPETELLKGKKPSTSYKYEGENFKWHDEEYTGNTIMFKHYCDYPTTFNNSKGFPHPNHTYYALQYIYSPKAQKVSFWIGAQTWATSDRRHGTSGVPGEWFYTKPQFYVNGKTIAPPKWENPHARKIEYHDENYFYRKPTTIALKKGWNQVLVKSPSDPKMRRWMFTFTPISWEGKELSQDVKEAAGLKFSTEPWSSK